MQPITQNPYRILGLPAGACAREISKKASRLKMYIETGENLYGGYYSFSSLGNLERTAQTIDNAVPQLQTDADKIKKCKEYAKINIKDYVEEDYNSLLIAEGSPIDITIKVDRSEQMRFIADFPTIEHSEELHIKINKTEPPTEDFLLDEFLKIKKNAKNTEQFAMLDELNELEQQLKYKNGSADGKLKLFDNLRKKMLILDKKDKEISWNKWEAKLLETYAELINFIDA